MLAVVQPTCLVLWFSSLLYVPVLFQNLSGTPVPSFSETTVREARSVFEGLFFFPGMGIVLENANFHGTETDLLWIIFFFSFSF